MIAGGPDLRVKLEKVLGHERYAVRRRALRIVAGDAIAPERVRLIATADDHSADVRLAFAALMEEHHWPDAIDALVALLGDTRNFASKLTAGSWSKFSVARAAARALGAYEDLPGSAIHALLDAAHAEGPNPFVACAASSALANRDDARVMPVMEWALASTGLDRSRSHRSRAQAAAWALCDRATNGQSDMLTSDVARLAERDLAAVAGLLLIASYAEGASPRQIARSLNADGVAAPGCSRRGAVERHRDKSRASLGDGILRNELYVGRLVWGRRQNLRDPVTGQRRRHLGKPSSLTVVAVPALRLIDDGLWQDVQRRLAENTTATLAPADANGPAFWDRRRPRHLLTSKVICGVSGGSFGNIGRDYLGCKRAKHESCSNRRTVRRVRLEDHVMQLLRCQIMAPELLAAFQQEFRQSWAELCAGFRTKLAADTRERANLDRQISRLVDAIADGVAGRAVIANSLSSNAAVTTSRPLHPSSQRPIRASSMASLAKLCGRDRPADRESSKRQRPRRAGGRATADRPGDRLSGSRLSRHWDRADR